MVFLATLLVLCAVAGVLSLVLPEQVSSHLGDFWKQASPLIQGFWTHEAAYLLHILALAWVTSTFVRERTILGWKTWLRDNRWLLVGVLAGTCWLQLGEPWGYRVYYDEPSHASVAQVMHLGRRFESLGSWHQPFAESTVYNTLLPMRMGLFPFLLSLLHDLTGSREANIYALNLAVSAALLLVLGLLGRRLGGRAGAWFALLGAASLPLLAQVANSGSYDLLAVSLLACLLLQILRLGENPCPLRQSQLLAVGLLLMLSRYEGAVYLLLASVFLFRAWWREARVSLGWGSLLIPGAILTAGIVRTRYLEVNKDLAASVKGDGQGMFSLSHVMDNALDALCYLFVPDRLGTGSALLCWIGLGSFALLLARLCRRDRARLISLPQLAPFALFTTFVTLLWCAVFLPTFWTNLGDPMASRFSLPLFLVAILSGSFAFGHLLPASFRFRAASLALFAIHLLFWSLPSALEHRASREMKMVLVQAEWGAFVKAHQGPGTLFAGESSLPQALQGHSATLTVALNRAPEKLRDLVSLGIYEDVYFLEMFAVHPATGQRNYRLGPRLDPRWEKQTVLLKEFEPGNWLEVSRVTGFRPSNGSPPWKLERGRGEKLPRFDTPEQWASYLRGFLLSEI